MDILITFVLAIAVGGTLGTVSAALASRLPVDVKLVGAPLGAGAEQLSHLWFIPVLGARHAESKSFDWPTVGSQLGGMVIVGIALTLHGFSLAAVESIVLATILLTILRIDWQHHLIFMLTIWPGIIIALAFSLADSSSELLSSLIAGGAAAGAFFLLYLLAILIYGKRALGLGDVFLAGLIGTMVGLNFVLVTLLFGMTIAALGGLLLVAARVRTRKDYIPYGAYLSLAAIVIVLLTS